jgi:hypothetical protein
MNADAIYYVRENEESTLQHSKQIFPKYITAHKKLTGLRHASQNQVLSNAAFYTNVGSSPLHDAVLELWHSVTLFSISSFHDMLGHNQ